MAWFGQWWSSFPHVRKRKYGCQVMHWHSVAFMNCAIMALLGPHLNSKFVNERNFRSAYRKCLLYILNAITSGFRSHCRTIRPLSVQNHSEGPARASILVSWLFGILIAVLGFLDKEAENFVWMWQIRNKHLLISFLIITIVLCRGPYEYLGDEVADQFGVCPVQRGHLPGNFCRQVNVSAISTSTRSTGASLGKS